MNTGNKITKEQLRRKLSDGVRNITTKVYVVRGNASKFMPTISMSSRALEKPGKNVVLEIC